MANFLILQKGEMERVKGLFWNYYYYIFLHRNDAFNILYSFNLMAFLIVSIGSVRNTSQCWVI